MPEWQVEEGIAEHRAALVDNGRIISARIDWPGGLVPGLVEDAVLISKTAGSARGTALFNNGEEALINGLAATASEGAPIRLEVTRAALLEAGRRKRAQARPTDKTPGPPPTLAQQLEAEAHPVTIVRRIAADWDELWLEAWHGNVDFAGGSLTFFPTPAMTLIDIDGTGDPRTLALAAVQPLADAIARFDLAGSIGIDFPTLSAKADRKQVDAALTIALADWPHERTAMNGFGFVQLVAKRSRMSVLERVAMGRMGASARLLMRKAEHLEGAGALLLTAHPGIKAKMKAAWLDELARRTGREIRWETDPALAIEAGHAQLVER